MKIIVKTKPGAKVDKVERIEQPKLFHTKAEQEIVVYKVSVKEKPIGGKANNAIIKALAEYFNVTQSQIRLISGQTSKQKIFEIL